MEMVACPRCGAQFDVTAFEPGTAFTCGACRNVLQVPPRAAPAAPVAPVVAPAAPAAAPAASGRSPDRRRAGAGAKGEGRAERLRRMREEGGPAKGKNPLPLVAALVAVVAVVAFGAARLLGGKDGPGKGGEAATADGKGGEEGTGSAGARDAGPDATGGAEGPVDEGVATAEEGAKRSDAPARPPEPVATFESLTGTRRLAAIEAKVASAARGTSEARDAVAWLEEKGLKEEAARALAAAAEKFPADPWVNERLGRKDRSADIRRMAADDEILFLPSTPEQERLLALHGRLASNPGAGWLDAEASARLDADLAALEAQREASKDPVAARTQREYSNLKLSPAFTGVEFSFKSARPYVIFAEHPSPERREEAEKKVERFAESLQGVYGAFLKFVREDLGMDAPRVEEQDDHRLKVFVFRDRNSFDAWHTRNDLEIPKFAGAYYQHGQNNMIMMHGDQEGEDTLRHEATHQLMHFYSRYFCQKDDDRIAAEKGEATEEVQWNDNRLRSSFFWFQEGIAEYFGNSVRQPDATWRPGGIERGHLAFFAQARATGLAWTVEEFILKSQPELRSLVKVKGGGLAPELFNSLAYAQGWSLVHFFRHGDGGKWRDKFHEFVRRELKGYSQNSYLVDAFGLGKKYADPKVKEWMEEVERSYIRYVEGLKGR